MQEFPHVSICCILQPICKKESFTPGSDGVSAEDSFKYVAANSEYLEVQLANGDYTPKPAVLFYLPKKNGTERMLARFAAIDMVVHRAVARELSTAAADVFSQ